MPEQEHWADPAYVVETADGEYVEAHSGVRELAEGLARDRDERHPEDAPHQVRETTFHEVNGTGPYEGSPLASKEESQ